MEDQKCGISSFLYEKSTLKNFFLLYFFKLFPQLSSEIPSYIYTELEPWQNF